MAEQESQEQQDKVESQPAAMPDYAAGLLAPTFDVSVSYQLLWLQVIFSVNNFFIYLFATVFRITCKRVALLLFVVAVWSLWMI